MSATGLNRLVGRAVVSERFRAELLDGRRDELLTGYDLSPEEHSAVMGIHADALHEFAAAVDHLIVTSQSKANVPQWAPSANSLVWRIREPNGVPRSR